MNIYSGIPLATLQEQLALAQAALPPLLRGEAVGMISTADNRISFVPTTPAALQSHIRENGVYLIDILPALPSAWKNGSVTGLRARGGFQVDLTWRDGQLVKAIISSKNGGKARLRVNGKIENINIPPGGQHSIP